MADRVSGEQNVTVETGSRLHFGLLSFGNTEGRTFGGVGVMIDGEGVTLTVQPAATLEMVGSLSERVAEVVQRYMATERLVEPPACRIEVTKAPRHHAGLGTGTQLGLAVGAGLDAFRGIDRSIEGLATTVGRGLRSAVGAYGFAQGGLLYEEGKLPGEVLSPLAERLTLPSEWRFVLFCDERQQGLSGEGERTSFANLPPVASETTQALQAEINERMLPAARQTDVGAFGESVYRYGCLAGTCFATEQGGIYASLAAEKLVGTLRAAGVHGVGQSSWGPTIFSLAENENAATRIIDLVANEPQLSAWTATIASIRNVGATVQFEEQAISSVNR